MKYIESLTEKQKGRFDEWADLWIEIGLRTGEIDKPLFESSVKKCYSFAKKKPPERFVYTTSPLVTVLAGPIASCLIIFFREQKKALNKQKIICEIIDKIVAPFVKNEMIIVALEKAVMQAIGINESSDQKGNVVLPSLLLVREIIANSWTKHLGGQFLAGGYYWSGAYSSFFREVCGLELEGDLWDRAIAYEGTVKSACWWWPHTDFVICSARPLAIHTDLVNEEVTRGWNSHQMHHDSEPTISWSDGFAIYAIKGIIVNEKIVKYPEKITCDEINAENNTEIKRIMIERLGFDRYITEAKLEIIDSHKDNLGKDVALYKLPNSEFPIVRVTNSSAEPDGTHRIYVLTSATKDAKTALDAVASLAGTEAEYYKPLTES